MKHAFLCLVELFSILNKSISKGKKHKGKRTEHTDTEARSRTTAESQFLLHTLITEELNLI